MAAEEVIHFPFWAQLSWRPNSPLPPEPVAEPPPWLKMRRIFGPCGQTLSPSLFACPINTLNILRKRSLNEETRRAATAAENGAQMNKADFFTEIYLWNLNMDRLIRVLQRLELHSIRSQRELRAYAIRLEEIRAGLNADFAEAMAARERADEFRFRTWRTALEKQTKPVN